jgi:S-methylmethionine-dependent homocysteine/selenocysteine methylase
MRYRDDLPQLSGGLFLTDGGIETTLIFHRGLDLPEFAAFDLLKHPQGTEELRRYYRPYVELAREHGTGFVFESPTWRANPDWAERVGYTEEGLEEANRKAIELMQELRVEEDPAAGDRPLVISGCVGPQSDGYSPDVLLSAEEAREYHSTQVGTFADTPADMVTAITMTYAEEATGVALAARDAGIPAVISFTVETDGRLPSGQPLGEAIAQVDEATGSGPAYYMINCAHPTHFEPAIEEAPWRERIRGVRANASTMSHAELDEATELDEGDPADFGARHAALGERLPHLTVFGGCCGTDHRHVGEISAALRGQTP